MLQRILRCLWYALGVPVEPACTVRLYVGAGVPGRVGRYKGLPVSFDPDVFRDSVEGAVKRKFKNATFFETRGVWQGGAEDGYMAEVIMGPVRGSCADLFRRAETLASEIALIFGQEAVLLVTIDATGAVQHGLVQAAA